MLVFAHGLEGSPLGTKSRFLRGLDPSLRVADMRGIALQGRFDLLEEQTRGGGLLLVGSSYGGLVAALLALRYPERFSGLVLCAPALGRREPPNLRPEDLVAPPGVPTVIIHGLQDDVVPIEHSRAYRDRSGPGVVLHEVDDDHRLSESLDLLGEIVQRLSGAS